MIVAFVPARAGSKRLPRKNVLPFAGKPLLAHTVELALACPSIGLCCVSTNDPEAAEIAASRGARVVQRPEALSTDVSRTADAARHLLEVLDGQGIEVTAIVTLQPNCPLRTLSLVEQAIALFKSSDCDSVVSVTQSHHKLGRIVENVFVPDYVPGMRSQDLSPRYFENGVVYVTRAALLREASDLFGKRIVPLESELLYALGDIDTAFDFELAEILYTKYRERFVHGAPSNQTDGRGS
jgi:N-acylneuraminate cytidylyltransferase